MAAWLDETGSAAGVAVAGEVARASRARSAVRGASALHAAVALLPMSSLAVLQAYDVSGLYPAFGEEIDAIVLGAVAVMELAGPILTQLAVRRAGEASPVAQREDR